MKIELMKEQDITETQKLIERTLRVSFPKFYPEASIDYVVSYLNEEKLKQRMITSHFYVAKIDSQIVGCGGIAPYFGKEGESILLSIFVDPNFQKQGIGKKIVETLENDEYGKRAKRIEVPASMVGIPFYKKLGYEHKNGELNFDDGHFAMEKFKK